MIVDGEERNWDAMLFIMSPAPPLPAVWGSWFWMRFERGLVMVTGVLSWMLWMRNLAYIRNSCANTT